MEPMEFDITRMEIPVKIDGKNYILREASVKEAKQWRGSILASQFQKDGQQGLKPTLADSEPLLVSLCLTQEDGAAVSKDVIETWPAKVVRRLFDKIKEISDLNEKPATLNDLEKERERIEAAIKGIKDDASPEKNS